MREVENYFGELAVFNTNITSDMKHNGEVVKVLSCIKGRIPFENMYTIKFKDGTILENVYASELRG